MTVALHVEDVLDRLEKHCLTIKDILAMKLGEKIDVLILDRNWTDHAFHTNIKGMKYNPEDFFMVNKGQYVHEKDMKGIWTLYSESKEPLIRNYEFHVEYKPGNWYPFENGALPEEDDEEGVYDLGGRSFRDFPPETRLGYRGMMVPWDILRTLPQVYF